jgi:hypothetical protein
MNAKAALTLFALLAAAPLSAKTQSLTVHTGESWVFSIQGGQPVRARKVDPSVRLLPGQVLVTVRTMMGTTMTISSNNPVGYTYKAELIGAGKLVTDRACTLPADRRVSFEHWPQTADAVRLSNFAPAPDGGSCP